MLESKQRMQMEKKLKVYALLEKQRNMITYNPLVTKEPIENRFKDIQTYKSKISQEKYFPTVPNNALKSSFYQ